jgi:dephospho-CoA kinase
MAHSDKREKMVRGRFPQWAITGNIGSGKSTLAHLMTTQYGWSLVDADRETHALYRQNEGLRKRIGEEFGKSVLQGVSSEQPYGCDIDRKVLGDLVFSDDSALQRLNAIVYEPLFNRLLTALERESNKQPTVLNAALVVEWGMTSLFDKVILVTAPDETRLERIIARSGGKLSRDRAWERLRAQMPQEEKRRIEGIVELTNNGTIDELAAKLETLFKA